MLKIPDRPVCSVCNITITAGTGLFVASGVGPVPEPTFTFVHGGGSCPAKAGAVSGGGAIYGPLPSLAAFLWDGGSMLAAVGGPVIFPASSGSVPGSEPGSGPGSLR